MIKLTRLHRNFLLLTLMVAITAINGCSSMSGARYDSMIPVDYDIVHKQMKTVSIDVRGGVEPNKSLRPMISNEEFTKAIVDAVTRSQAFSQVVPESRADYILIVTIISLEQPTAGRQDTVKMEAAWTLKNKSTGQIVWQKAINSQDTTTGSDASGGVSRVRLADEVAGKKNIKEGLSEISRLNL